MIYAGCFRSTVDRSFVSVLLLFCAASLFSLDPEAVFPSPEAGLYAGPQMVAFARPQDSRLAISLDGAPFYEPVAPVLLSVPAGTERSFIIDTELRSLLPDSPVLAKRRFVWRIDRKAPAAPVFSSRRTDGGRNITITLSEPGTVEYQMYHVFSGSKAASSIPSGATLFVPDGTSLCAVGTDTAGNRGPAGSPGYAFFEGGAIPFKIVNPVPGNWSNPQVLLVDSAPDTDIFYSLDGSDPALSGLAYNGPVTLPGEGVHTLRMMSRDAGGKTHYQQVFYSVTSRETPAGLEFPTNGSVLETADFSEIKIPSGYTYAIGDANPSMDGGKSILFSAVRGVRRWYPVTVSNGNSTWRWICASGGPAAEISDGNPEPVGSGTPGDTTIVQSDPAAIAATPAPSSAPPDSSAPIVTINDWYFIAIEFDAPVYYSPDGASWVLYTEPVFSDRERDSALYWYSTAWKNAAVQTIRLPTKPQLSGVPSSGLSGTPVFLSVTGSPCLFYYEIGSEYPPAVPGTASPQLTSGLLCEVPGGASGTFSVRVLAVCDGLVQGELDTRFIVDRKPPRTPSAGLNVEGAYSRSPVRLTPTGEETIKVAIQPSRYTSDGKSFILEGDPAKAVTYSIVLFAIDPAGNTSPTVSRSVTVDLNALYIDSSVPGTALRDGSPALPFANLDDALDTVRGNGTWRLYVKGQASLSRSHTLQSKVFISGGGAVIHAEKDASLVVSGGSLSLSGCSIAQETPDQTAVLFDIRNGAFTAAKVKISRSGGGSTALLRSTASTVTCDDSQFDLAVTEYALLFDIKDNSVVNLKNCLLSVAAANSSALSLTASKAFLSDSALTISSGTAGRAIEAWNSQLSVSNLTLERKDASGTNRDTALWLDKTSRLVSEAGITVTGFWRYKFAEGK